MTEIEVRHIHTNSKLSWLIRIFPASDSPGSAKVHHNGLGALCSLGQAGYVCLALEHVQSSD